MTDSKQIAKEIVKQIKRAKPTADLSEAEVLDTVDRWQRPDLSPGLRKQNKKYAEEVIEWIKTGERLLTPRRDTVRPSYFFSDWNELLLQKNALVRMRSLKKIFDDMRRQCEWIIEQKIGEHGNAGQEQVRAAWAAVDLMERHGLPLAYSSENSAYRTVARLLFEAMTGRTSKNGADIARACKSVVLEHNEELALDAEDEAWDDLEGGTKTDP
jgi:hypothetical protein